tara:strand:- start:8934 stop:10214 length:1281 start_codon:yes stop_codon:yes gene_type:complete
MKKINKVNIFCLLLILILLIILIYNIFYNCKNKENYDNTNIVKDCSSCRLYTTNRNCVKIYDISYNQILGARGQVYDINNLHAIDTGYKFCPWEEQCSANTLFSSNEERKNTKFNCCGNNYSFYNNHTINYQDISRVDIVNDKCLQLENILKDFSNNDIFKYKNITSSDEFFKIRKICNTNKKNIYINSDNVDSNNFWKSNNKNNFNPDISGVLFDFCNNSINHLDGLKKYNPVDKDGELISNEYLINTEQFYDCIGNIKEINMNNPDLSGGISGGISGEDICMNTYYTMNNRINFFGVDPSANYSTISDNNQRLYPNYQDFEMELKKLNNINLDENTDNIKITNDRSIITKYLSFINNFYENESLKMKSSEDISGNLKFINDEFIISNPLKNVSKNNKDINSNCYGSITNNNKFNYCGIQPYNDF